MIKPGVVKVPRELLITRAVTAKKTLVGSLESGHRNWEDLRRFLEQYIENQQAADVLAGYDQVEPV